MENAVVQKVRKNKGENLKKPLYLNECACRKIHMCSVCRSKYNKQIRDNFTEEDRKQLREYAKLLRENMTEKEKEARREKQRNYNRNLTEQQKANKKIVDRRSRQKQRAIKRQQRGINGKKKEAIKTVLSE